MRPGQLCLKGERNVLLVAPEVDGGQRPATAMKDVVSRNGRRKVQSAGAFARPVLERSGGAIERDMIRPFIAEIIAPNQVGRSAHRCIIPGSYLGNTAAKAAPLRVVS